jgi:hypothetical protein
MPEKKLNALLKKLTKNHLEETARNEKKAKALNECIDRDNVYGI